MEKANFSNQKAPASCRFLSRASLHTRQTRVETILHPDVILSSAYFFSLSQPDRLPFHVVIVWYFNFLELFPDRRKYGCRRSFNLNLVVELVACQILLTRAVYLVIYRSIPAVVTSPIDFGWLARVVCHDYIAGGLKSQLSPTWSENLSKRSLNKRVTRCYN